MGLQSALTVWTLSQLTLQLHPWLADPESFSTPLGVFSLEHGVNRRGLRAHSSAITVVAILPCTHCTWVGWGSGIGGSAQLLHAMVGIQTHDLAQVRRAPYPLGHSIHRRSAWSCILHSAQLHDSALSYENIVRLPVIEPSETIVLKLC